MLYSPPKPSQDKSPIWVWLDYLVKWATSERVFIQGWTVTHRADGKYFTPPPQVGAGQKVYMQACLQDGTTCYVPVLISGTIYRLPPAGAVVIPTINAAAVPNGSNALI
jgi:hypothetical protein